MAAVNSVGNALTGLTGTGSFVGSTSPALTTPNIGVATATSLVFSPTTNGIIGTTTNNDAVAGSVGEFVNSVIPRASSLALTSTVIANLTSISLTAGDWDVWGNIGFIGNNGTLMQAGVGWVSSTSASAPDASLYNSTVFTGLWTADISFSVPILRFSLSGTTTIYLSVYSVFTVNTNSVYGGIYARRRR